MVKPFELEVDEDVAFENSMVEYQVYESVGIPNQNTFLARLKAETVAPDS